MQITKSNLNRQILRLALPAIFDATSWSVAFFFLTMIVGSRLGTNALAGAATARLTIMVVAALYMCLGYGTLALVAQAVGAQSLQMTKRYAGQAVALAVALGGLCTLVLLPNHMWVMHFLGARGEPEILGGQMLAVALWSLPMMFVVNVGSNAIRGYGDTTTPMIIISVTNGSYVLGTHLLISKGMDPMEGLRAAGVAVFAAQVIGCVLLVYALFIKSGLQARLVDVFRVDMQAIRQILSISLPAAGEQLLMRTGFVVFWKIIWHLGTAAAAVHSIGVSVESISFMPGLGFQVAAMALVGQCVGARDYKLAREATRRTLKYCILVMGSMGVLLFVLAGPIVTGLMRAEPEVARLAILCIKISAFEQVAFAYAFVYAGSLRGAGDTLSPMLVTLVGSIFLRIPFAYFIGIYLGLGIAGVWAGAVIEWWIRAGVVYLFYRWGRWERMAPRVETAPGPA